MKLTSDKKTTTLVKKFLKKKGLLTIPCQFQGFGDCVVRFVSVSESDQYNWRDAQYARYINFEIIMKREGEGYSESRIPSPHAWGRSRQSFFKQRKYMAQMHINQILCLSNYIFHTTINTFKTKKGGRGDWTEKEIFFIFINI